MIPAAGEAGPAPNPAGLLASGQARAAVPLLRRAVQRDDASPATHLNLAIAEDRIGNRQQARRMIERLAQIYPDWDEPPLRLAESFRAEGQSDLAAQAYGRVLELNPSRTEALLSLAVLHIGKGDGLSAQPLLLRCCRVAPDSPEAWDALGISLMLTGDAPAAESAFAQAQLLNPGAVVFALRRVEAAFAAGSHEAELARLELVCKQNPLDAIALSARGLLLERLGRRPEALDCLEAASVLAPDDPAIASLFAGLLGCSHRLAEAEAALARAVAIDPSNVQLGNDHAAVLIRMHRPAEARRGLQGVLAAHGKQPGLLCNLVNATVSLGLQREAEAIARDAIAQFPDSLLPWRALSNALPYREGVGGSELLDVLQQCAKRLPRSALPELVNSRETDRRLRLGLLSGTLKTHPVGWLTVAGFENLDPSRFEIICLAQNGAWDPIARRFRAIASEWHDIDGFDDAALARHARGLSIDILIDLGGYGDAGRMTACAHRLAPVQIKWVGMQSHSSGIPEMDWFLTDAWETPAGFEHFYTERLLRLPDGYVCYSPPSYAAEVAALPALSSGYPTFGCFNNLAKLTPATIRTWSEILVRVPKARLLLKSHQYADEATAERMLGAFALHGVDPGRIELRGPSPHRVLLAEYNQVDIALDPFPYSGGLTTCEALWMGVPTVTLAGETFASRHSMSHMCNVGLEDWVADHRARYIEIVVQRAGDLRALSDLRAVLRTQVRSSPLCDAPRFGRNLADALRNTWRDWCRT
ncbi:MAG: tetratricopeptide repeat protein [Acetobacteraceae bacterium]|nr:tetratricopeptide repeat protein [Acetobacteraceae bacterium]